MSVLHATWLPSDHPASAGGGLAVWGETAAAPAPARRGRKPKVSRHPFAADAAALNQALRSLPADAPATAVELTVALPSSNSHPLPSPEVLREVEDTTDAEPALAVWQVAGCLLPAGHALRWLVHLPERDQLPPGLALGADVRFWRLAARFALSLLARQRFVPNLVAETHTAGKARAGRQNALRAVWQPWLDDPADRARLAQLAAAMPPVCRAVQRAEDAASPPAPTALLADFLVTITDAHVRQWAAPTRKPTTSPGVRPELRWRNALLRSEAALDDAERNLASLATQVQEWLAQLQTEAGAFRLCFRLEAPETAASRPAARAWTLRYLLQAVDDLSLLVPAEQVWRARGKTLRYLDRRFDQPQERMLAGLGKASRLCEPIEASLHAARPEAAALTTDEAYTFLRETALLLEESGFGVLAPQWWGRRGAANRLGARLKLRPTQKQAPAGGTGLNLTAANYVFHFDRW